MKLPIRLTLLAAAASAAGTAPGQTMQAPEVAPQVEINAAAARYQARRDDTASKIVVTHDEINKYGDTKLFDVLKRLPGLSVVDNEVRMRGLGGDYTQVLVDGEASPPGFSIDTLAPDAIERIEIMRAATAEFSTQSIAGTINIVLKRAVKAAQRDLELGLSHGGGNRATPNFHLQLGDKLEPVSYTLGIQGATFNYQLDNPQSEVMTDATGAIAMRRDYDVVLGGRGESLSVTPRLVWKLDGGATLSSQSWFSFFQQREWMRDQVSMSEGEAAPYGLVAQRQAQRTRTLKTDLNLVHTLASGVKIDLRINGSQLRTAQGREMRGYDAGGLSLDDQSQTPGRVGVLVSTGKLSKKFADRHALVVGWDASVRSAHDRQLQLVYEAEAPLNAPTMQEYTARARRVAAYAQDEWDISTHWSMYLGARWEGLDTTVSGTGIDAVAVRTALATPLLQTLYKVPDSKGDQWRFALTRTFKAPGTYQLMPRRTRQAGNSSTVYDKVGNPALKAETAFGVDLAWEHFWAEGAMLSASASRRKIAHFMRPEVFVVDGRRVERTINDGSARTRGLELEAKFPLNALMDEAPPVELRASVSRNWSTVDALPGPDNRIGAQSPLAASIGIDYSGARLGAGTSFVYGEASTTRVAQERYSRADPTRELDAYVSWKLAPKDQLRLSASGLLAREFVSETIVTDAAGETRRTWRLPGSPILRLALEMKF